MTDIDGMLGRLLQGRLTRTAQDWLAHAEAEISEGTSDLRFTSLLSLASRHTPRAMLDPTADECSAAAAALAGWNPERWQLLETARAALILARTDLDQPTAVTALEDAFLCADEGELRAFYRTLPLLPEPERFRTRMAEACRSNMTSVFEAATCDNPFPVQFFDDIAWHQLVIKAVFIEAPVWRVYGLDTRLDPELTRMTLDLIDEKRSAGRPVPIQAWICLGPHGGERALTSIEAELESSNEQSQRAAILALARAKQTTRLHALTSRDLSPAARSQLNEARSGSHDQAAFSDLIHPRA